MVRILMEWQRKSLTEELRRNQNYSEMDVFNNLVAYVQGLQKKLDKDYHRVKYLRDRLLTAADVTSLPGPLSDRTPRTAQHIIQGMARRLSDK